MALSRGRQLGKLRFGLIGAAGRLQRRGGCGCVPRNKIRLPVGLFFSPSEDRSRQQSPPWRVWFYSVLSPYHTCKASANASNRFTRWNLWNKRKTMETFPFLALASRVWTGLYWHCMTQTNGSNISSAISVKTIFDHHWGENSPLSLSLPSSKSIHWSLLGVKGLIVAPCYWFQGAEWVDTYFDPNAATCPWRPPCGHENPNKTPKDALHVQRDSSSSRHWTVSEVNECPRISSSSKMYASVKVRARGLGDISMHAFDLAQPSNYRRHLRVRYYNYIAWISQSYVISWTLVSRWLTTNSSQSKGFIPLIALIFTNINIQYFEERNK